MEEFSHPVGKIPTTLLERYLTGEASAEECVRVESWKAATAEASAILAVLTDPQIGASAMASDRLDRPLDPQRGWAKVARRIEQTNRHRHDHAPQGPRRRSAIWRSVWGAAAALAVGATFLIHDRRIDRDSSARSYVAADGQRAVVTLADGNRITLAPGTVLRVDSSAHVAALIGDAYFEIDESRRTPFTVRARGVTANVLGTTFDIRHYQNDAAVQVSVVAGKVSVSHVATGRGVTLAAGMVAVASDSSTIRVLPDDASQYTAWTHGQLVFHKALARDVAAALGRAYGVDILIPDSTLATQSLSWSVVLAQRSLVDVLESLGVVLDAHAVQTGHVVTLIPGKASPRQRAPQPRSFNLLENHYGR